MTLFAFPSEQTRLEALRTRLKLQFQHGALPTQEDYYLLINLLCDCVLVAQALQARPAPPEKIQVSADDPLFLALEQRDEEIEGRLQALQTKLDSLDQRLAPAAPAAEAEAASATASPGLGALAPSAAVPKAETPAAASEVETIGQAVVGAVQIVGAEGDAASASGGEPDESETASPRQDEPIAEAASETAAPVGSHPPAAEPVPDEPNAGAARIEEAAEAAPEPLTAAEPAAENAGPDLTDHAGINQPEGAPAAEASVPASEAPAESIPLAASEDEAPSAQAAAMPAEARDDSAPVPAAEARAAENDSEREPPVADPSAPAAADAQDEPGKPASALRRLFDTLRGQ
ncbi:hypothetical protein VL04_02835 [Chromobacterium violaceum]|uniref:hypothetical protein n=1 Tax=Chromobacterium violaceum TaxID=536 RepID=UPI000652A82D|nr:hypothetical protein [Chromobacterium violaceum]KMN50503.1 hypothetical protein VK93_06165 [Chromobacterium violaceum]KMN84486.1 hypothetical protein VL02_19540 [Chromobacterium violaceum]KMN91788.1 hypothetical protein VL04_02835 [Chromobacterium violaceum]KMO03483.1 hypothetical protein VL16_13285 [Chromobacterium violaceum]